MKVLFFPGSLETGGAQAQAKLLALGLAGLGHEVRLVTLFPQGKVWDELQGGGALSPEALFPRGPGAAAPRRRWGRRWRTLRALGAAAGALEALAEADPPDVVLSSLYVSNFLAARAWPAGRPPLVWSVRGSDVPWTSGRRLYFEAGRRLAERPRRVIYNSFAGRDWHLRRGFPQEGATVIVNGIDTESLRRDRRRGEDLRRRWNVGEGELLVGLVGRISPMKDHGTFLEAAAAVAARLPSVRFVCVGAGPARRASKLRRRAEALGLTHRLVWAGEMRRMDRVYNSFDVLASSSAHGEGFSNVLAEAMACEVPAVATDCGDAARVLGDCGAIVARRDSGALAAALLEVLEQPREVRQAQGEKARARVVERFSVEAMVEGTGTLLRSVVETSEGGR